MSLKYKLTLIFAVTLILLMAITAAAAQRVARLTVEADLKEQLDAVQKDISSALSREVDRRGYLTPWNAREVVKQSLIGHPSLVTVDLTYWQGTIAKGVTVPVSPFDWLNTPGGDAAKEERRTLRQVYFFNFYGGISGKLALEASLTEADRLATRLSRIFLGVTGSALLILLGVIYYLANRLVSAPLSELWRLTRRVAAGELEVEPTLRLSAREDEVGILATSFQHMLSALRKARDENQTLLNRAQGFNRELEARVQEATSALAEKNEALIEAREELARRERLAALGQLAGSIAHEIGTPLSTLSGYLQLVLAEPNLPGDVQEPLQVAAGEAQRMTRIIRRFLDSTRGLRPAPETIDLRSLVENVVELTVPEGAQERHPVRIELNPDTEHVVSDPGLLRQVLINLAKNAIDAMGDFGTLTVRALRDSADLVIEVEDEGPGVPVEDRQHIFEPFFTTKEAGRGTGLGLAICKEIMRALHGSLSVTDGRHGRGARFILRAPAFKEAGMSPVPTVPPPAGTAP